MIRSKGENVFAVFNNTFFIFLSIIVIFPFWEVIRISFSSPGDIARMGFRLIPSEPSISAYKTVMNNAFIWVGYFNSIVRVLLGVSLTMLLMVLTAYPLSKTYMPARKYCTLFLVFTMFFSGGLIPSYLLVANWLKLYDSIWSLILPGLVSTYSMLIVRNYFMSLPESLTESARIDGASEWLILFMIIIPISKPILMTVMLWGIVGHWNAWFDCLIYIKTPEKFVLQLILRKIVIETAPQFATFNVQMGERRAAANAEAVKCATILVSTLPIMCVYPFIQKHFVRGIIVGSLKG